MEGRKELDRRNALVIESYFSSQRASGSTTLDDEDEDDEDEDDEDDDEHDRERKRRERAERDTEDHSHKITHA